MPWPEFGFSHTPQATGMGRGRRSHRSVEVDGRYLGQFKSGVQASSRIRADAPRSPSTCSQHSPLTTYIRATHTIQRLCYGVAEQIRTAHAALIRRVLPPAATCAASAAYNYCELVLPLPTPSTSQTYIHAAAPRIAAEATLEALVGIVLLPLAPACTARTPLGFGHGP